MARVIKKPWDKVNEISLNDKIRFEQSMSMYCNWNGENILDKVIELIKNNLKNK